MHHDTTTLYLYLLIPFFSHSIHFFYFISLKSKSTITPDVGKLLLCIIIDVIGTSSELIPFVGEFTDIAWAPIAALALRQLYGSNVVFALEFAEEFLPFTDIIPLATICWVIETFYSDTDIAKGLQIGQFQTGTIIDVDSPSNRNYNK